MLKSVFVSMVVLFSSTVFANPIQELQLAHIKHISQNIHRVGFVVGDTADYKLNMGGFINGTMKMSVKSIDADGIWMVQDVDLSFMGKQLMESLIDPATGQVKKLLVNGQEQEVPATPELELIEIIDDTITVPAGSFDCQHIRLLDKSNNSEIKIWSSADVSLSGLVKQIAPSQLGQVTTELTGFYMQPQP